MVSQICRVPLSSDRFGCWDASRILQLHEQIRSHACEWCSTIIADQIDTSSMSCNAECMILYPRATPDIPKYDDLDTIPVRFVDIGKSIFGR